MPARCATVVEVAAAGRAVVGRPGLGVGTLRRGVAAEAGSTAAETTLILPAGVRLVGHHRALPRITTIAPAHGRRIPPGPISRRGWWRRCDRRDRVGEHRLIARHRSALPFDGAHPWIPALVRQEHPLLIGDPHQRMAVEGAAVPVDEHGEHHPRTGTENALSGCRRYPSPLGELSHNRVMGDLTAAIAKDHLEQVGAEVETMRGPLPHGRGTQLAGVEGADKIEQVHDAGRVFRPAFEPVDDERHAVIDRRNRRCDGG